MNRQYAKDSFRFLKRARYALYLLYREGRICEREYLEKVLTYDRLIDRLEMGFCPG